MNAGGDYDSGFRIITGLTSLYKAVYSSSGTIANGSITTDKLADGSVTLPKLAPDVLNYIQLSGQDDLITFSRFGITLKNVGALFTQRLTPSGWKDIAISSSGQYQSVISQNNQIFTSSDFGITWIPRSIVLTWKAIALSVSGQYQSAVVTNGNIYTSSDFGVTWTQVSSTPLQQWTSIAISSNGRYQTATSNNLPIWTSTDYGVTWQINNTTLPLPWTDVAISASGQYQTACSNSGLVYSSNNYGVTWTSTSLSSNTYTSVSMSASGQYQLVTTNNGLMFLSTNFSTNWSSPITDVSGNITSSTVSANGQYQFVSVGTPGGLFFSENYGVDWQLMSGSLNLDWSSIAISSNAQYISACAFNDRVYTCINSISGSGGGGDGFQGYQGYRGYQGYQGNRGYQGYQGSVGLQGAIAPPIPSYGLTLASNSFTSNSTTYVFQPITWSSIEAPFTSTTFNDWSWASGATLVCPKSGWYSYSVFLESTTNSTSGFSFGMDVNGLKTFSGGPSTISVSGTTRNSNSLSGIAYFDDQDLVTFGICAALTNNNLGVGVNNKIFLQIQNLQGFQGGGGGGGVGVQGYQGRVGIQGVQGMGVQGVQGFRGLQGFQGIQGYQGQGTQGVRGFQGIAGAAAPTNGITIKANTFTSNSTIWLPSTITWSSIANPYSVQTFNDWNWVSGNSLVCPASGWYTYNIWVSYTSIDPLFTFFIDVDGEKAFGGASSAISITGNPNAGSSTNFSGMGYFDAGDVITFGICSSVSNDSLGISVSNPVYLQIQSLQGARGAQGPLPTFGETIAIGANTGVDTQGQFSVAVGSEAGKFIQGTQAVAIGYQAGSTGQSPFSVALGSKAGQFNQGNYSIALGYNAGATSQASYSTVINATGSGLSAGTTGLFVKPIRSSGTAGEPLVYDPTTGEIYRNVSSQKYKTAIEDLDATISSKIYDMRPVCYRSNTEKDTNNDNAVYYGLIAEEVEQIEPGIVVYTGQNEPDGIQYDKLIPLILKEMQLLRNELNSLRNPISV